jgi:hypothetical protein
MRRLLRCRALLRCRSGFIYIYIYKTTASLDLWSSLCLWSELKQALQRKDRRKGKTGMASQLLERSISFWWYAPPETDVPPPRSTLPFLPLACSLSADRLYFVGKYFVCSESQEFMLVLHFEKNYLTHVSSRQGC